MSIYIILEWYAGFDGIMPTMRTDGSTMIFETKKEALKYAQEELNFEWKIIKLP
jgi:hypothetical protein